jgi:hypothetical protein
MPRSNYLFTSESVSEGHPDKVCDRISDTVVDAYLSAMPEARLGVETLATTNRIVIAGEVRGPDSVTFKDLEALTREAATSSRASTGRTTTSPSTCTRSRPILPRAWMPLATRMRARATRASCSATRPTRPPS